MSDALGGQPPFPARDPWRSPDDSSDGHPDAAATETAILHAFGALPADEARVYEAHISSGCEACASVEREAREVLAALGQAAGGAAAPPASSLRERLLETVRRSQAAAGAVEAVQVWKSWKPETPHAGFHVRRAHEGPWDATAVSGVSVKPLHVDSGRNYVTMLVRMEAGSSYPRHLHSGAEECYVLEGDLHVGDDVLQAGDYQRAEVGSAHGVQSTVGGCLLLIVSSQKDELF